MCVCVCVCVCVRDGDFNYNVMPLDRDKRLFYESAVKTFKFKNNKAQF